MAAASFCPSPGPGPSLQRRTRPVPRRRLIPTDSKLVRWANPAAPAPELKRIIWPEIKPTIVPTKPRLLKLTPSSVVATIEDSFFTSLPYDVRRYIYDAILAGAGRRQHIFCPSACPPRAGPLFTWGSENRYLRAKRCDDTDFENAVACGHWECELARARDEKVFGENKLGLGDLVRLMQTCKFVYLEVSEFLYRSTTFVFASFPELQAFTKTINPAYLANVRSVAFVIHADSGDAQLCQRFIKGEFFETEGENSLDILKEIPKLQRLEVNLFPSLILAISTQLHKILDPLTRLHDTVPNVIVRVPAIVFATLGEESAEMLPGTHRVMRRLKVKNGGFTLKRPFVAASLAQKRCKAYSPCLT
ncbi:hypothetical protein QBC46DRAFT_342361 [Diplogelasinospora grovesii]|uniref:DUF7730 domain-containing protein n=1 Tax=Diplogelasinospora grovesii TaxID=303347 RepID=A0AAN6N5M4_9PEZI|nr:hypothetical protein QBC46DRAFT_342361 [Diplogelasinospora grovesii]